MSTPPSPITSSRTDPLSRARIGAVRRLARHVLGQLGHALSPRSCGGCRDAEAHEDALCGACRASLIPAISGGCSICGAIKSDGTVHGPAWRCRNCILMPPPYAHAVAAHVYGGPLRDAIIAWKNRPAFHLSAPLADLFVRGLQPRTSTPPPELRVVPVPTRRDQLARRGFNPAAILAEGLVSSLRRRPEATAALSLNALGWATKHRHATSTKGSRRRDRVARVSGAFEADAAAVAGRDVWLVDDVLTTGATVAACADALLKAGASRVEVLVLARVEGPRGA